MSKFESKYASLQISFQSNHGLQKCPKSNNLNASVQIQITMTNAPHWSMQAFPRHSARSQLSLDTSTISLGQLQAELASEHFGIEEIILSLFYLF